MFPASKDIRLPFDPVTISYVMALRGVRPRIPKEEFIYGELGCGEATRLILFAACNPEGTFFGFDHDVEKLKTAASQAEKLGVKNVTFSQADAVALKAAVDGGVIGGKCFDYLVYNDIDNPAKESVAALQQCALALLRAGGSLAYRYRIFEERDADSILFASLTRAILAEQPKAGEDVAKEWRALSEHYCANHPADAAGFDDALKNGKGIAWLLARAGQETRKSKTIEVTEAFSGREMTFLGSAAMQANYMELSTPESAHAALTARRLHPLYEAMKDLSSGANERIDIWAREPLTRVDNLITLFGGFTFGTTESAERISRTVNFQKKSISFAGPLYDGILSLATVMPITMGDLVHHETLSGIDDVTLLNTLQLLVACGILHPMRASFDSSIDMDNPKLLGSYNQSLRRQQLDLQDYAFASTVVGRPVVFQGMGSLVIQMLDKGGTGNVGSLLGDELMRLSSHPYLKPLNLNDPQRASDEAMRQIETVFNQSMVRWFSLGIIHNENA